MRKETTYLILFGNDFFVVHMISSPPTGEYFSPKRKISKLNMFDISENFFKNLYAKQVVLRYKFRAILSALEYIKSHFG